MSKGNKHRMRLALLALAMAGCGGTAAPTDRGTLSCNVPGPKHICIDWAWFGGKYDTVDWQQICQLQNGTPGTVCDRTGNVGGCQYNDSVKQGLDTITRQQTVWYFYGTVPQVMIACTSMTGYIYQKP